MTTAVIAEPRPNSLSERFANQPLWVFALAALAVFAAMEVWAEPGRLATRLGDSDDATRLVTVRDLLGGAPWLDTTLPRFGAPEPLVSHWSRLVDAPLALLIGGLGLLVGREAAETTVRAAWPLLVFLPLLLVLARHSALAAGRAAGLLALGFAVYAHTGVVQFAIGRIDHHNVMITASIAGILLLGESFRSLRAGWLAGFAIGLSTAVGYEALALNVAALAIGAVVACWTGEGLAGVSRAALSFLATLTAALVLTTAPSNWLQIHCDALSANMIVLAAAGAVGLRLARRHQLDRKGRLVAAALPAIPALALYAAMEPQCLSGPFGQVAPAVFPIWLDDVQEVQSLLAYMGRNPQPAAQFAIWSTIGIVIAWLNLDRRANRRAGEVMLFGVLVAAVALALWQIKLMPYATFLAVPPLAVFVARMKPVGELSPFGTRLLGFFAFNQHTILIPIMLTAKLTAPTPSVAAKQPGPSPDVPAATQPHAGSPTDCLENKAIAPLAGLPPGLMVTDADFGPFIVALTPHRVLSAPYHRLDTAILETEAIKAATPGEARNRLAALGADYVAVCRPFPPRDPAPATFAGGLHVGRVPDFLEPVPLAGPTPYLVWRLKRA